MILSIKRVFSFFCIIMFFVLCCSVCSASTDTKWILWIEERFNISMAEDHKITFHHFKKALNLDKVGTRLSL